MNVNALYVNSVNFQNSTNIYGLLALKPQQVKQGAPSLNAQAQQFVTDAKVRADGLKLTMINLMGKNNTISVFDKKTAVSRDTDSIAIKSFAPQKNNFTDMTVKINQVAATQKNTGASLASTGKNFTAGLNIFEIESGGKKTSVSFTVSVKDDNRAAQQKMADAINSKGAGVTASVVYDDKTKTSALVLESLTTGDEGVGKDKFKIRDEIGRASCRERV